MSSVFPTHLVSEWESVADVFCAAFGGSNTTQHMRDVPSLSLVDTDSEKLEQLVDILDRGYVWVYHEDAYEWAEKQEPLSFDAVVLDPWTGDQSARVLTHLDLFARLARKHLVVGLPRHDLEALSSEIPGWTQREVLKRSDSAGGVYWLVLEREANGG